VPDDYHSEQARRGDAPVDVAPAAGWVEAPPFKRPGAPHPDYVDSGRYFWLADCQMRWTGSDCQTYSRTITEVVAPAGLQETAQVDVDFDPAYERLVFNHIRVIRGGDVREVDPAAVLSVFRRERDLERALYDGRLTAHLVVPDLRVGDVLDVGRTVAGHPPILAGGLTADWRFEWGCWVGETRVRLLTAAAAPLEFQSWNGAPEAVTREIEDGFREHVWVARETPPGHSEPDIPGWVRYAVGVRATTPMAWSRVADTFRGYYAPEALPADLKAEIDAITATNADPASRAVALLRSVQKTLRYQAVSIGDGGFIPRPLAKIWALRAGDCKDASRLLTAMMIEAGLDACPALVNTARGWALRDEAASLTAFNHCIVRLRLDGRSYWLDPTNAFQGGRLDLLHQARFGWALPLTTGSDLESMGEHPVRDVWQADETFELGPELASPATLKVTTTFASWRADLIRQSLTNEPGTLTRNYVDYYGRLYGEATELAPMEVEDDLEANEIRTVERYSLAQPWLRKPDTDEYEFGPADDLFANHLTTGRGGSARRWAIDMGFPRRLAWTTTMHLPQGVTVNAWDRAYSMPGISVTSTHDQVDDEGRVIRLRRTVSVERQFLPASEAEAYFDLRDAALRTAGVTVSHLVHDGRFHAPRPAPEMGVWPWLMTYGWRVVAILVVLSGVRLLLGALGAG